ncbi:hypothetical protein HPP92_020847 [Vanilla planifolia]|uniref:DUF7653 domain-containing protein n=1 Tax=Vanilla planifolia TaxID=51239 RepID=A0A835UK57_VANPL|nr:hypothetical protein HPP92_020847 [Vanilla planifolia]
MRRFFSFRSTLSSGGNDTTAPSDLCKSKKRVNSVVPVEKDVINSAVGHVHCDLQGPKDSFLKPLDSYMEKKDSSNPYLRRSRSFSSLDIHISENENNVTSLNDHSKLNYYLDDDQHVGHKYTLYGSPFNPESYGRSKTAQDEFLQTSNNVKMGSPSPSGSNKQSSGNSACSSPIPLRCRATRLSKVSGQNKVVDLYIDQEHHPSKTNASCQNFANETGDGVCLAERVELPFSERPPRAICKIPSSFNYNAARTRSYSFREIMNKHNNHSGKEWITDDAKPDMQDFDSQTTTTVADIYEDSSDGGPILNSNFTTRECSLNLIPPCKEFGCHRGDLSFDSPMKVGFPGGDFRETEYEGLGKSVGKEQDSDEWLFKKVKELEECYHLLFLEDPECDKFQHGSSSISELFLNIRKISEDRRNLASELCLQIRSRLAERSSANCRSKQSKLELDTRTRRLEKEKNDILLSLKKELDRRSNEWSSMLSKLQTEEQRLRERVRELAEQNVSFQREVASLKGGQVEAKSSIGNLEKQLNDSRANQDELKAENYNLRQAILELQERCNRAVEEQNHIRSVSMEIEKENRDLQKLIAKFQRSCCEQEKTICELRQSYDIEIGKKFVEGDNVVVHLQTEQLRLTGVELKLRRELDSCRVELDSLRKENIRLFDRLQSTGNKCSISLIKLDQELHAWIECLQLQGLSLLDNSSHLCGQLLHFVGQKQSESFSELNLDSAVNSVAELASRFHSIRKAIENFRRSLQVVSTSLNEKSGIQALEGMCSNTTTTFSSRQDKVQKLEDEVEAELKAEFILTRLLREKIYSREVEIEQLHEDLAASIRNQDLLSVEIQRLQDEVSCLTHKKKDLEIQGLKKDENVNQLQRDLQECMNDLAAERNTLRSVSKERDQMWEEVKRLRESNMLMNCELKSLHKKVELLDEDILYRDGQICILKESLENKPFPFICSPTTMKEFNMQ